MAKKRENGFVSLGTLIGLLLFGGAIWVLFKVLPFFYYAEELRGFMEAQAEKNQVLTDEEMRRTLLRKIRELQIPIDDPEDLKVNRFNGNIVIEVKYSEVLFIDIGDKTYDLYVFNFHPRVERPE